MILLYVIGYLVCCVLSYGMNFGFFQNKFTAIAKEYYYMDMRFALFTSLLGPAALLGVVIFHLINGYPFRFKFK